MSGADKAPPAHDTMTVAELRGRLAGYPPETLICAIYQGATLPILSESFSSRHGLPGWIFMDLEEYEHWETHNKMRRAPKAAEE